MAKPDFPYPSPTLSGTMTMAAKPLLFGEWKTIGFHSPQQVIIGVVN
ncbi:MAG TPA: hypothetical protein VJ965_06905 [Anaerolineales bacterium]|nr:hypothetical protein [Anaerolineales bacterium]